MAENATSFEQSLQRLETIGRTIQDGCGLDEMLALVREGEDMYRACNAELQRVEAALAELTRDERLDATPSPAK